MSILISVGFGSGKTTYLCNLIGMMQRTHEYMVRAMSTAIFLDDVEVSISDIICMVEDDETRIKRLEKEFLADMQKQYGDYKRYGIDVNAQLDHKYKDCREQFEQRTCQRVELNELHKQVQECRNKNFATIIRYRFHLILEKILRSKGEVRQKPPLISSLEFIFKNQFLILQRFFDMRWIKFNHLHNPKRTSWVKKLKNRTSMCQRICMKEIERYMQNRIHPDRTICY